MGITYNKRDRLIEFHNNGVSRWYTLWNLAQLGIVSDEALARCILAPGIEVLL